MDVQAKNKYGSVIVEAAAPNAYALEDYTIAVDHTLLTIFSDNELMCVLAHEIAHLSLGHHREKAAVSGSNALVFRKVEETSPDTGLLQLMIKPLAVKAFSREQEEEADIEAIRAMRVFNIPPDVCVAVLLKLQEIGNRDGGGMLDSHPSMDERIRKIREAAANW